MSALVTDRAGVLKPIGAKLGMMSSGTRTRAGCARKPHRRSIRWPCWDTPISA
jgi:hypothetical protein